MFVLKPHTVFSLRPQPINTESAPKNVVDAVSDSRQGGVAGHSLGSLESGRWIWGK